MMRFLPDTAIAALCRIFLSFRAPPPARLGTSSNRSCGKSRGQQFVVKN
jgi:hypothetical protein